jgi:hypothetical protein
VNRADPLYPGDEADLQSLLRIRWIDEERRVDLEFQCQVELVGLPSVGDEFVLPVSDAGDRVVTAVVELDGCLPIVVLNTVYADVELPPHCRHSPSSQMVGWHTGFVDAMSAQS